MRLDILVQLNDLKRKGVSGIELMHFIQQLKDIDSLSRELLPTLIELLQNENWMVRCWAAEELGKWGNLASAAIPALEKALKDDQYFVTVQAETALKKITEKSVKRS